MPKMDGIGANEYVVTVTQNAVDFYGVGDTPITWELNMWYHTLNCGFRPRIGGETDYPCVFDERVGVARSYFKSDSSMNYDKYVDGIKRWTVLCFRWQHSYHQFFGERSGSRHKK